MRKALFLVGMAFVTAILPGTANADHNNFLIGFASAGSYGDVITFKAQLVEPDPDCGGTTCPISNRQVDFFVDGQFIGTDVTNSGGYAILNAASQDWHVGNHRIDVRYDRSSGGAPATVISQLTIVPEGSLLAARSGYLEARLTDNDNTPMSGFAVRFHVTTPNGEQELCTAFTDAAGNARCTPATGAGLSPLDAAETTYHATFDGTSDYSGSSDDATLV